MEKNYDEIYIQLLENIDECDAAIDGCAEEYLRWEEMVKQSSNPAARSVAEQMRDNAYYRMIYYMSVRSFYTYGKETMIVRNYVYVD